MLQRIELEAVALFPLNTLPSEFFQPTGLEQLAAGVASSTLWVAEAGSAGVVGFLLARTHGISLHIEEMDVSPAFGQRGIGARLLAHARDIASDRGHRHVTLTTFEHLPWNAPFYMKQGFERVADFAGFPHLAAALRCERERGLEHRVALVKHSV
jgi:GNAT superfamily N-acetyltransferase